jgi:hypothetical protein
MRTENEQLNEAMDENARIDCSAGDCHGVITTLRSELSRLQEQSKADQEARDEARKESAYLVSRAASESSAHRSAKLSAEARITVLNGEVAALRDVMEYMGLYYNLWLKDVKTDYEKDVQEGAFSDMMDAYEKHLRSKLPASPSIQEPAKDRCFCGVYPAHKTAIGCYDAQHNTVTTEPAPPTPPSDKFDGDGCRHVDGICAKVGFPGHVKPEDF